MDYCVQNHFLTRYTIMPRHNLNKELSKKDAIKWKHIKEYIGLRFYVGISTYFTSIYTLSYIISPFYVILWVSFTLFCAGACLRNK